MWSVDLSHLILLNKTLLIYLRYLFSMNNNSIYLFMVNFNFYVVTLTDKVFEYLSFLCTCLLFIRLFQNYIFQDFVIIHQSFFFVGNDSIYLCHNDLKHCPKIQRICTHVHLTVTWALQIIWINYFTIHILGVRLTFPDFSLITERSEILGLQNWLLTGVLIYFRMLFTAWVTTSLWKGVNRFCYWQTSW